MTPKQQKLVDAVRSRQYDQIFLIGPLGTAKTYGEALALIAIAQQYDGSYIPVARKTMAEAKVGTIQSYLEVLDNLQMEDGKDYRLIGGLMGNDIMLRFTNGSIIQFIPLDHTKDRNWQRVKSINATAVGIDEVDGVQHDGFLALSARTGRRNKNGAPAVTIATCNPNETWVKENVYTPWKKGKLPKNVCVIEFVMQDSVLYKDGFYDKYKTNPMQWQQRYLFNNWDYLDDDHSLFKSRILDGIAVAKYPETQDQFAGVDVADEGKDRSTLVHLAGNTLRNIVVWTKEDIERLATPEQRANGRIPRGKILGREVVKYCQANRIGYENVAFDVIGVGTMLRDAFIEEEFFAQEYKAGAHSDGDFDMLRSEVAVNLADEMEIGDFFIYDGCPHLADLKKELLYHEFETKAKIMCVESKKKIKVRLGKSPDIADGLFIAYWAKTGRVIGSYDIDPDEPPTPDDPDDDHYKPITAGLMTKIF